MKQPLILNTDADCDLSFRYPQIPNNEAANNFSDIPMVLHSNGRVCWEVTDYILHRYDKNPNIAKSTLKTYARHLSRTVRYLEYHRLSFSDLTDRNLTGQSGLMSFLQNPKHSKNGRGADNNQANTILNRLFELLFFLQNHGYISSNIISKHPKNRGQINVTNTQHRPKGSSIRVNYYSHPARLRSKTPGKRRPISEQAINTLVDAIHNFTDSEFIRNRWFCLLSAMEWTGAREGEIALLTTQSVNEAMNLIEKNMVPRLGIVTTKGKNSEKIRKVPVPESAIQEICNYITFYRNPLVSSAKKDGIINVDHDHVFVTDDGRPLTGKRIYDHFKEVRDNTNLKPSDATPHLFRHRYITIQVRERLDEFLNKHRNYKTDIESFIIKKVKLLTGHASDSALWGYVDDAMEELDTFKELEAKILSQSNSKAKNRKMADILSRAKSLKSSKAKANVLDELLAILKFD